MSKDLDVPKQLPYPGGEDEESRAAYKKLQDAYDRLSASLEARKNRSFDPSMMAMAAGFLAPTQTGGFGESLGKAMGNYSTAQQAAAKEEQDTAQQQYALAGQGLQMHQQRVEANKIADFQANEKQRRLGFPKPPVSGLTAAAQPLNPPEAGPLTPKPVAPPVQASTGPLATLDTAPVASVAPFPTPSAAPTPDNEDFLNFQADYINSNSGKGKTLGTLQSEAREQYHKQFISNPAGFKNIITNQFDAAPTGNRVEISIQGKEGTYSVPSDIAIQMSAALNKGDEKTYNELKRINIGDRKSTQEQARENKRQETLSESDTKAETTAREDFQTKNADAQNVINNMNSFRTFADDPDAKNMTGILANTKISSAIAALVKSGVGANDFRIGVPAIEDVMRNADLKPDQQAKYRSFLMLATQMQLDKERMMKGSTSDRERDILANANIGPGDTSKAIRMKADLLTTAAKFQKQMYKEWKNSKMTAMEFRDSEEFDKLNTQHQDNLTAILMGKKVVPSSAKPVNTNLDALKNKVNKLLED